MIQAGDYDEGLYVFLYPQDNDYCNEAIKAYLKCLLNTDIFSAWTLEHVANVIRQNTKDKWIGIFIDRYLNFDKIEELQRQRVRYKRKTN